MIPINKPNKSLFDLSYTKRLTGDMGYLYITLCEEVVAGDVWKVSNQSVVKFMPLARPLQSDVNVQTNYFFVPYRLLDEDKFESIFTGCKGGKPLDADTSFIELPKILNTTRTDGYIDRIIKDSNGNPTYSLLDQLGFPIRLNYADTSSTGYNYWHTIGNLSDNKAKYYRSPMFYPVSAYFKIWNEWYRDENLDDFTYEPTYTVSSEGYRFGSMYKISSDGTATQAYMTSLKCRWNKDYFVGALPYAQRGTAPALPVSGLLPIGTLDTVNDYCYTNSGWTLTTDSETSRVAEPNSTILDKTLGWYSMTDGTIGQSLPTAGQTDTYLSLSEKVSDNTSSISGQRRPFVADLSNGITFDINDLRLAFSIQRWLEKSNICGGRFHEYLLGHFGTAPNDDTLQRPLYLGGLYSTVSNGSVIQTSESGTTVQGNETGRSIGTCDGFAFKYHVKEPGIVMGLTCVKPKVCYDSQGIPRQWIKNNRYDFFFPEFSGLGEQEVLNMELFAQGTDADTEIFGFQGRYDEMRSRQDFNCGLMRADSDYNKWSLNRHFSSLPTLSTSFIECSPDTDRIKAVTTEPMFILEVHNIIKALRPIPRYPMPSGL